LNGRAPFDLSSEGAHLCYRFEGERGEKAYGSFAVSGPVARLGTPMAPVRARLAFQAGMSELPMYFVIDRKRPLQDTVAALGECIPAGATIVAGAVEILDATHNNYPEDTGRWAVDKVY
jgi:hypothetical protein